MTIRQPSFFRDDKVRDDSENGDETKDGTGEIEVFGIDGEFEGGEQDGEEEG